MCFLSLVTNVSLLTFIILGSSSTDVCTAMTDHDGCQGLLESFAEVTANFTRCTIKNARPIKVCQACVDYYIDVCQTYLQILKLHDEEGTSCKLQLINVDRLEVVEASYSFVINQWNRASCNDCFQNKSGSITPEKNTFTVDVLEKFELWNACVTDNKSNDTNSTTDSKLCTNCANDYYDLNKYYNDNKALVHGFCMDVVDMINSTRSSWSQDYGCCAERERPETIFLVIASSFCFIPIIFYLFVRLCTAKHLLPISTPKRWEEYLTASSSSANLIQS